MLKLDDRTLPSGFRTSTDQVQSASAPRAARRCEFNFGASIHRVVGLDLADAGVRAGHDRDPRAVEAAASTCCSRSCSKAPAVLRLSYLADVEDAALVQRRLEAVKQQITDAWKAPRTASYELDDRARSVLAPRRAAASGRAPRGTRTGDRHDQTSQSACCCAAALRAPRRAQAQDVVEAPRGEAVERQLPSDEPFTPWVHDPHAAREAKRGDRLEKREVAGRAARDGEAHRTSCRRSASSRASRTSRQSYVETLREVLDELRDRRNVRLHLVGHADDAAAVGRARARVRRQRGPVARARRRGGGVPARRALALPPEAISYEWAGDTQPIAINATAEGRALNRRVEVEVWYDEPSETRRRGGSAGQGGLQARQGLPHGDRLQAALQGRPRAARAREEPGGAAALRGRDYGGAGRLHRAVRQALDNLQDKQNVVVKFIGYTDDAPLTGRNERIYGDHARALARRARTASRSRVQEA